MKGDLMPTNNEWSFECIVTPEYKNLLEKQAKEREKFHKDAENDRAAEMYREAAESAYGAYRAFVDAGFSDVQAWKLLMVMMQRGVKED